MSRAGVAWQVIRRELVGFEAPFVAGQLEVRGALGCALQAQDRSAWAARPAAEFRPRSPHSEEDSHRTEWVRPDKTAPSPPRPVRVSYSARRDSACPLTKI